MGFRGTSIQRPADAVKIFLLFCIPPAAPSDNCAPLAFLAFGSSLFFGAMPVARSGQCGIVRPFARGAMRAQGSGCCGLRRNAPSRAPYFACGSIRAWGSGCCRRRLPCRRRQYACAARLCAQSAYAAQWASPAGRRAAPPARPISALFSILWLPICVKSRRRSGAAFFCSPASAVSRPSHAFGLAVMQERPIAFAPHFVLRRFLIFEFCSSLKR